MPGIKKKVWPKYKPKKKKKTNQLSLLEAIDNKITYNDLTKEEREILEMAFADWIEKGPSVFEWSDRLIKYSGITFK